MSLPADRIAGIDRLRIVAAIGIVWFHTTEAPYRQIGYAGLPMFLLIFYSLIARHDAGITARYFLKRRWNRLLKPWLFWSAVYGLCGLAKAAITMDGQGLRGMFTFRTFFTGTSIHLWYLPYAFISGLLVFEVNRRTRMISHATVAVLAAIIGMLTLAACATAMAGPALPVPLPQWEFGLAAIPLGLAIGRCLAIPSLALQKALLAAICVALLEEGLILQSLDLGAMSSPYGIAIVSVCLAYSWETRSDALSTAIAPLTCGIYLVHPMVIYALSHVLSPSGHSGFFIALTVCISALITLALSKTSIKRFL